MAPKNTLQPAPFDDIHIIGINTTLIDYKMAWYLNDTLKMNFVRYDDIKLDDDGTEYSFFYYDAGENRNTYNLIALTRNHKMWIKLNPRTDYLLIVRNPITDTRLTEIVKSITSINNVTLAFVIDINKNKDINNILATIELHEGEILAKCNDPDELKKKVFSMFVNRRSSLKDDSLR